MVTIAGLRQGLLVLYGKSSVLTGHVSDNANKL